MQKVKTFFHIFSNSLLPQAPYYHKLLRTKASYSLKYFLSLIYIVNLIFAVLVVARLNYAGFFDLKNSVLTSLSQYPKELTIMVRDGKMRSTYDRPYFFWTDIAGSKRLIAVVDETAAPSKVREYKALALFTRQSIVFPKGDGVKEVPYGKKSITVNEVYVKDLLSRVTTVFAIALPLIFVISILIAPLFFFILYVLYLVLLSGVSYLFFHAIARKVQYGKTFQLALHAFTLPVIVDYGLCLFKPEIAGSFFIYIMFFILSLIFVLSGTYEAYLDPLTRTPRHR